MLVSTDIKVQLNVHYGVFEYITGSEHARRFWEARGMAGHKKDYMPGLQKKIGHEIRDRMKDRENQLKMGEFIDETMKLYNGIIGNNREAISPYIDSRRFYFVLGTTRTGGTYLQRELGRAVGWPVREFLHDMIHDSIPHTEFIMGRGALAGTNNMVWRKPFNYFNFAFQLAQLLVYLKRAGNGRKNIVLKHSYFCFCLPPVDEVFKGNAEYIVTVRHPGSTAASRAESRGIDPADHDFRQMCFKEWMNSYSSIVTNGLPEGSITPVLYGGEMDCFLRDFFKRSNFSGKPGGVKITPREYDLSFWEGDCVRQEMERIGKLWELYGLKFPVPEKIQ